MYTDIKQYITEAAETPFINATCLMIQANLSKE